MRKSILQKFYKELSEQAERKGYTINWDVVKVKEKDLYIDWLESQYIQLKNQSQK